MKNHSNTKPDPSHSVSWKVPRSKSHLFNQQIKEEILEAITPALFGDYWDYPELLRRFEKGFAELMNYQHVSAVQSGTAALLLALRAMGLQAGDEVITVANSDMSTTGSISHCGATPVLCDVYETDYTMNLDRVEALITPRTRGLLPVDLYGHPANVRQLREIADRYHLFIVEDAAIATAARDYDMPMGAFADMVCFSTVPTKQIGSVGNGGMVATALHELWEKLEVFRGYGLPPESAKTLHARNDQIAEGYNLKMSPVDAAVLTVKLAYFPAWTEKRKQIALWYEALLQDIEGVTLPTFRPESQPVRREFALCVRDREKVFQALRENGVQAALNYFPPAHQRPVYQQRNLPGSQNLPVTDQLARQIITLPVDPLLDQDDIAYVCQVLKDALK